MASVDAEVNRLIGHSMSDRTFKTYETALNAFDRFRVSVGLQLCWPAATVDVIRFAAQLSLAGRAHTTAQTYIAGIANHHKLNGWDDPTKHFVLHKVMEGFKRSDRRTDSRVPITIDLMKVLLPALQNTCSSVYEQHLFKAAFLLAFFGFLRIGEVAVDRKNDGLGRAIQLNDIKIHDNGQQMDLRIKFSKNDQLGRSVILKLGALENAELCPLQAVRSYITMRGRNDGPLFMHFGGTPLTRYQFSSMLQAVAVATGNGVLKLRSHSFRIGAATTASLCGLSEDRIKVLGRWKSNAYQRYIRMPPFINV